MKISPKLEAQIAIAVASVLEEHVQEIHRHYGAMLANGCSSNWLAILTSAKDIQKALPSIINKEIEVYHR